jgi:hypothetical protein
LFILERAVWLTNTAKAITLAAEASRAILFPGCGGKPAMNKYRMNNELSSFAARLRNTIPAGGHCFVNAPIGQGSDEALPSVLRDAKFNTLALDLFTLQYLHNPAYRIICEARKLTPRVVEHWTQIPAVPTSAFKELELSCIPPEERTAVFHSSGTTEQKPSRHFHCAESLALYEVSLWPWFEQNVLRSADGSSANSCETRGRAVRAPIILTPPPEQAPYSSLVHMLETVRRKLGAPDSAFVGQVGADGAWTLDFEAALAVLSDSTLNTQPSTIILGTAFSFVHLLDFLAEQNLRFKLPAGSRVMETGGYKNRSRSMPKAELHALITERLGVSAENILCEYGMSEISSQAYAVASDKWQVTRNGSASCHLAPVTCHFAFPPWAQVQIISPETGREVAEGETGLIRVFDLANAFSVATVQTEDLGIRRGDGFELIGRAQLAEPRGCSLMSHSALRAPHSALK